MKGIFSVPLGFEMKGIFKFETSKLKFFSLKALKWYLNDQDLSHGWETAAVVKISAFSSEAYFIYLYRKLKKIRLIGELKLLVNYL